VTLSRHKRWASRRGTIRRAAARIRPRDVGGLVILYGFVSLAFLLQAAPLHRAIRWLPRYGVLGALTFVGPAALLLDGGAGWKWFVALFLAIAACLAMAWLTVRQSPDSAASVGWVLAALTLWAMSGWLLVIR
jgi:hypothetical protein